MIEQILFALRDLDKLTGAGTREAHAHTDAIEEALRERLASKNDLRTQMARLDGKIGLAVRDLTIRIGV